MSRTTTLERIANLIALAGSDNENEARSAAYHACKMIREGGFRVVAPAQPAHAPSWDENPLSTMWRAPNRAEAARSQATRPDPDRRPRRPVRCEIRTARRSGRCAVCDEPFDEGSDVAVPTEAEDSTLGTVHADCRARWTVIVSR